MAVLRVVANLHAPDPAAAAAFYSDLLGLDVVMDQGWIVTLATRHACVPQLSLANQGGADTALPDVSIEVDDIDAVHARAVQAGHDIPYQLTDEPWGVRRFYVRDPAGNLVNILGHL